MKLLSKEVILSKLTNINTNLVLDKSSKAEISSEIFALVKLIAEAKEIK